jgi:membrane protease YdiL (CAAX protease family)
MTLSNVEAREARPRRGASFVLFLLAGLLLFESQFFALNGENRSFQIATFVGLPVLFSILAIFSRRSPRFAGYWPAFFSYSMEAIALSFLWLLDDLPARWLGFDPKSPQGMAMVKVSDTVVFLVVVVVLMRIFQVGLGSIFLQKGRLGLGLAIGLAGFAVMATFGVLESRGMGVSTSRLIAWAPWLLIFVLANGFFEELMSRGLFLKAFEPLVGPRLANLVTALVFAIGHARVRYSADVLTFAAITFIFALVWGYVTQKTGALWGSALFHAGADTVIIIGIFAGVKI